VRLIASATTECASAKGSRGRLGFFGLPPSLPFSLDDRALALDFTLPMSAPTLISFPQCGHFICPEYRTVRTFHYEFQIRPLPEFLIAYPAKNGILHDWHGKQIGTCSVISSRPAVFFGRRSSAWKVPTHSQTIQPWQFGHGEIKRTCFWLRNLPPLQPTKIVEGRTARAHRAPPGPNRWKERSRTLKGIADAMAEQWGSL
jgi:hypothetical protein